MHIKILNLCNRLFYNNIFVQEAADASWNFDEVILEAAKSIAAATSALVKAASAAQRELIDSGKVRYLRNISRKCKDNNNINVYIYIYIPSVHKNKIYCVIKFPYYSVLYTYF